jgi:hypothetical protein
MEHVFPASLEECDHPIANFTIGPDDSGLLAPTDNQYVQEAVKAQCKKLKNNMTNAAVRADGYRLQLIQLRRYAKIDNEETIRLYSEPVWPRGDGRDASHQQLPDCRKRPVDDEMIFREAGVVVLREGEYTKAFTELRDVLAEIHHKAAEKEEEAKEAARVAALRRDTDTLATFLNQNRLTPDRVRLLLPEVEAAHTEAAEHVARIEDMAIPSEESDGGVDGGEVDP